MIYPRRALQHRLNGLRPILGHEAVDKLKHRLNSVGKDRTAAMWELVVLHGLAKCGRIRTEDELPSGRRPDIFFESDLLSFIADVTSVSDEGVNNANPFQELMQIIETEKRRLKLPTGGLDVRVGYRTVESNRGNRTVLKLPPKKELRDFVRQRIVPEIRRQMEERISPIRVPINEGEIDVEVTIDPRKAPFNSGSYAVYDNPTITDRNVLYSSLASKPEQLRGAEGITGIVVGDGDCAALSERSGPGTVKKIADEFLRQYSSITFVLILSVRDARNYRDSYSPFVNHFQLYVRESCTRRAELNEVFEEMIKDFPIPAMMPVNGALRAQEKFFDLGYHGGYGMDGSNEVRIGLREFTEILSGLRTLQDNGAKNIAAARKLPQLHNHLQHFITTKLAEGCLPESVRILPTDENESDSWVVIKFGSSDPAISPFE